MPFQAWNARYLADLIFDTLEPYLTPDTHVAFEGLSYGSSGNVVLQLGGYKYMLMDKLSEEVPYAHMYTYSPITIKKTAGCSKKGVGKPCMIETFASNEKNNQLAIALREHRGAFMKKGGKTYVDHLDDLVDSYWTLQTMVEKDLK